MNDNAQQLTLSYELLYLLQWLIENEPDRLKRLIEKALVSGLREDLHFLQKNTDSHTANEEMHYSIVDFLALLEDRKSVV